MIANNKSEQALTNVNRMNEDRLELLAQVAVWYFEDGIDQNVIAGRIGRSRSMVSRMLAEVRERGIVEFRVNYPLRRDHSREQAIENHYGIDQAWVLGAPSETDEDTRARILGKLGARCLQSRLFDGVRIGVGLGGSVQEVIRSMPTLELREAMVVQLIGTLSARHPEIDSSELTRMLAERLNAESRHVPSPAIVNTRVTADSLLRESSIQQALESARNVDVALIGVGTVLPRPSSLHMLGFVPQADIDAIKNRGAVGDLLMRYIDRDGGEIHMPGDRHVIGVPLEALREIPSVIAVAAGGTKVESLQAALAGRYFDVLVTDADTADALMSAGSQSATDTGHRMPRRKIHG